ncbi:uncharacterized protein LOC117572235 [Drosophila albomicans]|uniref:Uncharacterized protein LOC117572235 n=1 Tax=Drosophila albomicans TaxID=7291 RepID=A0A6P8XEL2_DROAB|nr:uncharacterized protein LOC117572235 [Drosophila albomicans]
MILLKLSQFIRLKQLRQTGIFFSYFVRLLFRFTRSTMCLLLLLALCVGMIGARPLTSTEQPSQGRHPNWPGVPDERLADAEVDNAYELFKWQTEPSTSVKNSKVDMGSINRAMTNELQAKLNNA